MSALNPNHPVTRAMEGNWHKVLAIVMLKLGFDHVVITPHDIVEIGNGRTAVVAEDLPDGLHIRLVSMAEGERLARKEGGLPA